MKFADAIKERPSGNLMVVDALNLAFRYKHSKKLVFAAEYRDTVKSLAKSYNSGSVVIAADWGKSTFRREIFPEYKANRQELISAQSEEEKREAELFFEEYERTLELLSEEFPVFRYKGVEADDIAAWIVRNNDTLAYDNIWLISSDRDWDLLIRENVSRFSYITRKETTLDTWDYDVSPEHYISYKCLIGDKGDNIPGITGIGPKKAVKLIEEYGDAFDIHAACPIPSSYKYIQTLNEYKDQLLVNYELMDLITYCEEAIGESNVLDLQWRLNEYRLQQG
jgi:5'-3' exonuclease